MDCLIVILYARTNFVDILVLLLGCLSCASYCVLCCIVNFVINDRRATGDPCTVTPGTPREILLIYSSYKVGYRMAYNVKKITGTDIWTCQCDDFYYRLTKKNDKNCKHIVSCIVLKDIIQKKEKIEKINHPKIPPN